VHSKYVYSSLLPDLYTLQARINYPFVLRQRFVTDVAETQRLRRTSSTTLEITLGNKTNSYQKLGEVGVVCLHLFISRLTLQGVVYVTYSGICNLGYSPL
jgi:hypothetical protein